MSLFAQELKKIWRPGIFVALLVSGIAFWFLVGRGPGIAAFPNGSQATFHFELAQEWADRFGAAIDDDGLREIREDVHLAEEALESDLATLEGAAERGIRTRADFDAFSNEVLDRELEVQQAGGEPDDALKEDIALREQILALPSCERVYETDLFLQAMEGEEGARGYLSHMWLQDIETYLNRLSTWLVVAPVFVMAPAAASDRLHHMRAAQWSSRVGRKVFGAQLATAMLSAALVLIASMLAWAIPFAGAGIDALLGCAISGPLSGYACGCDMTLGAYMAARIALMAGLGLAAGLLSFVLARMSSGYVGMLLRVVPVCAALGWLLGPTLFDHALCERAVPGSANPFSTGWLPVGGELAFIAAIAMAAIAACVFSYMREGRLDLR